MELNAIKFKLALRMELQRFAEQNLGNRVSEDMVSGLLTKINKRFDQWSTGKDANESVKNSESLGRGAADVPDNSEEHPGA
jgi:hypothetical protein